VSCQTVGAPPCLFLGTLPTAAYVRKRPQVAKADVRGERKVDRPRAAGTSAPPSNTSRSVGPYR
jgi:hypothetical protein